MPSLALWPAPSVGAARPHRRLLPVQACTGEVQRHFNRPSLYYRGLSDPSDVVQHCLTLFRRARVPDIVHFLAVPPDQAGPPCRVAVGGQEVQETGPLAPLAGVLDVGARRVLPGHLLRRSRVLSTLRLGGSFQQRVALTACTGEESVFEWTLQRAGVDTGGVEAGASSSESSDDEGGSGWMQEQQRRQEHLQLLQRSWDAGSDSEGELDGGGGRRWVVATIRRDGSCDSPLPTTPHPKAAPEAVVKAQLAALQRGDIFSASCFSVWRSRGSGFSLGLHYDLMRAMLAAEPYSTLLHHADAWLGPAALPSQRVMLQEVGVAPAAGGVGGGGVRFLWRLGMQANGCWQVTGIEAVRE